MSVVTEEVKRIATKLDAGYLRAISLDDFNERIRQINLSKPLVVLLNVPEIDNVGFETHTSIVSNVKLELLFIKKNIDQDDDGEVIQAILDDMETLANKFYDNLRASTVFAKAARPEGFILIGGDTHRISDERATGWLMTVTVPLDRRVTDCT